MSAAAAAVSERDGCPYPGLRRFDESSAHLYFGREREVREVVERLSTIRFLAITGESGCGKSSLIRAGVIPAMRRGSEGQWHIAILQPGDDPIGRLASELENIFGETDAARFGVVEATLRSSSSGLIEAVRQARFAETAHLLILVDQFEEIFRFKQSAGRPRAAEDARTFVRLLLTAATGAPNLYVVLTMRSDYLGYCAQFAGLPEAINRGEYLLSRPSREELREAIVQPAEATGARIAPRLAAQLLNEVGDDPGELPVLQHALMRTWHEWNRAHAPGEAIDLDHYRRAGSLKEALSRHADEVYNDLKDPELQAVAGHVFRALTEAPPGARPVRRPAPLTELGRITGDPVGSIETVVERFVAAGFLVANGIVDLTHESLITRWPRLAEWTAQEARDADLYHALARDAAAHARNERGLWREPELGIATKWRDRARPTEEWARSFDSSFTSAMAFLKSSEESAKRRRYAFWALLGAAILAFAVVMGALWWAQRSRANAQAARAEAERVNAEAERIKKDAAVSESERLASRLQELTVENPQLSEESVKLRTEVRTMEWNIFRLSQESQRLEWETSQLDTQRKGLDARAANLSKDIADTAGLTAKATAEIDALTAEGKRLEAEEQGLTASYRELQKANARLRETAVKRGLLVETGSPLVRAEAPSVRNLVASMARPLMNVQQSEGMAPGGSDELRFRMGQLERENLALKRSIQELRDYRAKLAVEEANELARNERTKNARKQSGEAFDAASGRVRDLDARLAADRRKLDGLTFDRNRLDDANSVRRQSIARLQGAIASLTAENDAIEQLLNPPKRLKR